MTGGADRPPVRCESSDSDRSLNRSEKCKGSRRKRRFVVMKDVSTSTDESEETDSWFGQSDSGTDSPNSEPDPPPVPDIPKPRMPRPTNEVPIYWRTLEDESREPRVDLLEFLQQEHEKGLPPARTRAGPSGETLVVDVRLVKVDTHEPSDKPRGIESLDLHAIVDLHKQLEKERKELPGELIISGKVSGVAVAMLIDSGATISVLSTRLWDVLHRACPGWTMVSTDRCVRTVSGEFARVRGCVVLEVELGGRYYTHQFTVMDVSEDIILGLDFIQKFQIDCNWRRGVLILKGDEVQACRRYTTGDGRIRKLIVTKKTYVPANSQVVVGVQVRGGDPRGLPEWGMVSPALKPMATFGVLAGKALVDPRSDIIPVPVINPGDTVVILPRHTLLGFLVPISKVGPQVAREHPFGDASEGEYKFHPTGQTDMTSSSSQEEDLDGQWTEESSSSMRLYSESCSETESNDEQGGPCFTRSPSLDRQAKDSRQVNLTPKVESSSEAGSSRENLSGGDPAEKVPCRENGSRRRTKFSREMRDHRWVGGKRPGDRGLLAEVNQLMSRQMSESSENTCAMGSPPTQGHSPGKSLPTEWYGTECNRAKPEPNTRMRQPPPVLKPEKVRAYDPENRAEEEWLAKEYEKDRREKDLYPDTNVPRTLVRSPREAPSEEVEIGEQFYRKQWSDLSDSEAERSGSDLPPPLEAVKATDDLTNSVPPHLRQLYTESAEQIGETERPALAKFLQKYEGVFARDADDLGRTNVVQHYIETGDARPIKQPPRRVPVHKKKEVQEEVEKMLKRGVIEPCDSPWASPIVLAAKKDGTTRFCVDFRRINDVTRKDAYPLPRIEDNLDTLQGAEYYSTLDLVSGFWQVEMAPEDQDKTAFTVGGGGLYRFLTMPFGLCNAPATFQRLMEHTLRGLQWETAVLYIDDIVVFSDSVETHYERLGAVLDRLSEAGLKLKPSKCQLLRKKVAFLGHVVSAAGVEVDDSKIVKIQQWPVPADLHQLRSFVGLCAYYRRFVPNFSTVCKPLFDLTKKGVPFFWGPPQHYAFETMKTLLTSAPILGYPRPEGLLILDCDASNVGVGAVLSQEQDGEERALAYASKTLGKAERNYCVTRRELLAIVTFVKQYHHYLYGTRFLVRTDHAALYWLLRKKDPEGQMARWLSFLQSYDMVIQHRPGVRHGNADALSRCMEGCRDLDSLVIADGKEATLAEIKQQATSSVRTVQTRAQTKSEAVEVADRELTQIKVKDQSGGETSSTDVGGKIPEAGKPKVKKGYTTKVRDSRGATLTGHTETASGSNETELGTKGEPEISKIIFRAEKEHPQRDLSSAQKHAESLPAESHVDPRMRDPMAQASRGETSVRPKEGTGARPKEPVAPTVPKKRGVVKNSRGEGAAPHREDRREQNAGDTDSRVELDEQRLEQFYKEQLPETWSNEAMGFLQDHDPTVKQVRSWLREGRRPNWNEVAKKDAILKTWWARYDQLRLSENGVLYLRWETPKPTDPPWYRVVAVTSMIKAILKEFHDAKTAGHLGQKKTIERVKSSPFYWPGMSTAARKWVQNCVVCASRKNPRFSKRTPLETYRVGSTMDRVSIDLVGPFHPRTRRGHSVILTITDQFSRWVEAFPLRDGKSPEIARKVVDFICRHGMPLELHSDQGRNVDGEVMKEVCRLLGVRKTHTTAYHPQGNAITERENSVIKAMLSAYVNERLNDWDDHLPAVMMAMRSSVHRTLQVTPNSMLLGREVRLPIDALVGPPPEAAYQELSATEYAADLAEAMQAAHRVVGEQVGSVYAYQKKNYDRQVEAQSYQVGQAVWLRNYPRIKGVSKSLQKPWDMGWIVSAKLSSVIYVIQKVTRNTPMVVHADRLKAYKGEIEDPKTKELQETLGASVQ